MNGPQILEYFSDRQEAIISLIREIVDIESPSFAVGQSRAVADWIENVLKDIPLDLEFERVSDAQHGDHVIIRASQDSGPNSLLLGHTDTVHPIGTAEKNPTRIEADKFYGCGIFDMKSNIVLM